MSDTRMAPSERLHALAALPKKRLGEVSAEAAIVRIASEPYGSRRKLNRNDMITLAREVCDANGWKYNGSR